MEGRGLLALSSFVDLHLSSWKDYGIYMNFSRIFIRIQFESPKEVKNLWPRNLTVSKNL